MTAKKFNTKYLNVYLLVGLLIVLAISLYAITQVQKQLGAAPATPKLAALTVTVIAAPNCPECFDASALVAIVQQVPLTNVTTVSLDSASAEAQSLIATYKLSRLPAAIVTGELEHVAIPGFTKMDAASVFNETPLPYYDLMQQRKIGIVDVTFIIDKLCTQCFDVTQFGNQLTQAGVSTRSVRKLDVLDKEAQELIKKYSIAAVPTMLLSPDAFSYEVIADVWEQVGTQENDGILVMRTISPPYRDLSTRQVRGLVTLTYLVDSSCTKCYNASLHKLVLEQSFGMKFKDEKSVDVSSDAGKKLVEKYGITAVPTIVLDKEAGAYAALEQAWPQVGTKHDDGTFVFLNVDMLQGVTYKDLATNTVKNATTSEE